MELIRDVQFHDKRSSLQLALYQSITLFDFPEFFQSARHSLAIPSYCIPEPLDHSFLMFKRKIYRFRRNRDRYDSNEALHRKISLHHSESYILCAKSRNCRLCLDNFTHTTYSSDFIPFFPSTSSNDVSPHHVCTFIACHLSVSGPIASHICGDQLAYDHPYSFPNIHCSEFSSYPYSVFTVLNLFSSPHYALPYYPPSHPPPIPPLPNARSSYKGRRHKSSSIPPHLLDPVIVYTNPTLMT